MKMNLFSMYNPTIQPSVCVCVWGGGGYLHGQKMKECTSTAGLRWTHNTIWWSHQERHHPLNKRLKELIRIKEDEEDEEQWRGPLCKESESQLREKWKEKKVFNDNNGESFKYKTDLKVQESFFYVEVHRSFLWCHQLSSIVTFKTPPPRSSSALISKQSIRSIFLYIYILYIKGSNHV